ncbi:MAG: S26 family signal peptidase, partial [Flavisolibacter sp.]|nr:S26 family signal peptidase [Flavisolibacter sp.]
MPLSHIFIVYFISFLLLFLPSFGLAKMFQKAGVDSWKAFVPLYNTWVMQVLAKRPRHWVFWQLIPVVGWFITPGIYIEFVKLFGRFSFLDHTLAALFAPFYFPYLGYSDKVRYIGPEGAKRYVKPGWREWVDAAIFAIVAATLIRTFVFEAYTIPSGSMEKTLLIND